MAGTDSRGQLGHLSRGVAQRVRKREAIIASVNDVIAALNSLYGVGEFSSTGTFSPAQRRVVRCIEEKVVRRKPPLETVAPQEAFRELLRGSAVYGEDTVTAPYRDGLVSLPDSVAGPPHVTG